MKHSKRSEQTMQPNQSAPTKHAERFRHSKPLEQKAQYSNKQIAQILQRNVPPTADPQKRHTLISQLTAEAFSMDYMSRQSLAEKLSSQISYMSPWSFLLQAGLLVILFCLSFAHALKEATFCLMSLTPMLTGILISELSKSFSHNMWEMEAACRYNLTKLFFLRICILSGTDFIVLAASLAAFRIAGGMLWQFACCTLLPFFLSSTLCLWLLQHFGNQCRYPVLLSVCILATLAAFMVILFLENVQIQLDTMRLDTIFLCASLGTMLLFLLCAFRLCTRKHFVCTAAPMLDL